MAEEKFKDPGVTLSRIYTRTGDGGQTRLVGGQRVAKDSFRIECYGTVDELNAFVGAARVTCETDQRLIPLATILLRIQHELFNLGSILATLPEDVGPQQPRITNADVEQLEHDIDIANDLLEPLGSFVLPGGSRVNTDLHIARTVCRRAERLLVQLAHAENAPPEAIQYLNRLSDALFVWSRWANHLLDAPEVLWHPNEAASGRL